MSPHPPHSKPHSTLTHLTLLFPLQRTVGESASALTQLSKQALLNLAPESDSAPHTEAPPLLEDAAGAAESFPTLDGGAAVESSSQSEDTPSLPEQRSASDILQLNWLETLVGDVFDEGDEVDLSGPYHSTEGAGSYGTLSDNLLKPRRSHRVPLRLFVNAVLSDVGRLTDSPSSELKVFVEHLPDDVTEENLVHAFRHCGKVMVVLLGAPGVLLLACADA